jgi:hypothetical protein
MPELIAEEYERGKKQSESDIAGGAPRLFWQTRGAWGNYMTQLFADRFHVTVEHISDITSMPEISFRTGYNSITKAHIDEHFGPASYQTAMSEVDRFRKEYYRHYFEKPDIERK